MEESGGGAAGVIALGQLEPGGGEAGLEELAVGGAAMVVEIGREGAEGGGLGEGGEAGGLEGRDALEGVDALAGARGIGPGREVLDGKAVAAGEIDEGGVGLEEVLEEGEVGLGVEERRGG